MNSTLRMQIGAKRVILCTCLSRQCEKLCEKLDFQKLEKCRFFFSFLFVKEAHRWISILVSNLPLPLTEYFQ